MSIQQLRDLSQKLQSRMKRGAIAARVAGAVWVVLFIARLAFATPENVSLYRAASFVAFLVYFFLSPYEIASKAQWPVHIIAKSSAGLEFYRTQLERRVDYLRNDYSQAFVFGIAAVVGILYATQAPTLGIPFIAVLAFFVVSRYQQRKAELPKVERELRALRAFERENPA